jgi:S-adenosylmethionine synthetase
MTIATAETLNLVISSLGVNDDVEVVERKGAGHPDSICDALAETLSRNLCNAYQKRFGKALHHNVDKALLCGGRASPEFGGGSVDVPIRIYLAGRAVAQVGREVVPIQQIATEGSRAWLRDNLHALDPDRHVEIEAMVQPGSQDLQSVFGRHGASGAPHGNDTSFGVGHAPLSTLEKLVLAIDSRMHVRTDETRAWGEDTKVMAVRSGAKVGITLACAMIGRYLANIEDYCAQKTMLAEMVRRLAREHGFSSCEVSVNAADDVPSGSIYLTVTGTSAEGGDDGQVGRGNRVNGLITPGRPMSLEAAAGKNPVSHVGKIYNVLAKDIAETLVSAMPEVDSAQCLLVSKIGLPITSPALVQVKLATKDGIPVENLRAPVETLIANKLAEAPALVGRMAAGTIMMF